MEERVDASEHDHQYQTHIYRISRNMIAIYEVSVTSTEVVVGM